MAVKRKRYQTISAIKNPAVCAGFLFDEIY